MKTKYEILISILDKLNKEAPLTNATYHKKDVDGKNHARSLSLIHLFLKSKFGLMDFSERVKYITDGGGDGGVDAYYIDSQNKSIYIIQSKFRSNKNNFEEKLIKYEEISSIEIERIRKGEVLDESDGRYNGKILGFQRKLDEIEDIVRYDYKVVLLANLGAYKSETIKRLLGGFAFDVYNFSRIYNEIVFPVCSGMYFDPRNITFEIETTEKGTEFSHSIETSYGEFSVRLIFVPALELARNVSKYRNSLLKFNPRNYLSLSNNGVNESIRESIVDEGQNIFALLNNGITFVATSDSFTDRTGRKGKGKLTIVKPQIINGGQTAYTLGKLLEEGREKELQGKSVLVKIITSADESKDIDTELIEKISLANNRQSKIVEADQRSNSPFLIELQQYLFENHNLFFERKRGEFFEGIEDKYLPKDSIVNRVDFIKSVIAFQGEVAKTRTSQDVIFEEDYFLKLIEKPNKKLMSLAYLARRELKKMSNLLSPFPALGAFGRLIDATKVTDKNVALLASQVEKLGKAWPKFEEWATKQLHNSTYIHSGLLNENYYKGKTVDSDVKNYFSKRRIVLTY